MGFKTKNKIPLGYICSFVVPNSFNQGYGLKFDNIDQAQILLEESVLNPIYYRNGTFEKHDTPKNQYWAKNGIKSVIVNDGYFLAADTT